ncbi:MAG: recombinase family protein [Bacteroidales bacterium]|nr:recombinase family protein [Bacteroidales bacterium]
MAENTINAVFTPKKAILYLRVSTRKQAQRGGGDDEGYSIPAQRGGGRKTAADLGAVIVKEFIDRGASAKSINRKDLQEMLKYIEENDDIDYLIIHKVDRLARNRFEDADITRALFKKNIKLVSASESIDETPAGMLLHGIMASIAEFYSNNLATEVKKGMGGKVEKGGTISKAPLGYLNLRRVDEMGREERYVEPDPDRHALVALAFDMFSTGEWVVEDLADHLALRGLTTRTTPNVPSKPIDGRALNKILINPYYKGMVKYQGKYHPGKHKPLTDEATWQKVQDVLASHINGERTREHPHFLKSIVYCGGCGERLLIQYAKSRSGIRYPYFSCAGRHSKRTDCQQKSVLIEEVERQVENLYRGLSFTSEYRQHVEDTLLKEIRKTTDDFAAQRRELEKEKEKMERQQRKLLEMYYADALPADLFKEEQRKLADGIAAIDSRIQLQTNDCAEVERRLGKVMGALEDCGALYANASEQAKRIYNLAFFEKIYVCLDKNGITVAPVFTPTYALIFNQQVSYQTIATNAPQGAEMASQGMENGLPRKRQAVSFAALLPHNYQNRNQSHFFGRGFSNNILVGHQGLEPRTNRL